MTTLIGLNNAGDTEYDRNDGIEDWYHLPWNLMTSRLDL